MAVIIKGVRYGTSAAWSAPPMPLDTLGGDSLATDSGGALHGADVMNDARLSTTLPGHPKTKRLIRKLGDAGAWHFVKLILWAAQNHPDGKLPMAADDIEIAVDWPGAMGEFVACLREVRFLDGEEGAFEIHDWAEHNPWVAGSEMRSDKARFAALCMRHGRERAVTMMPEYAASVAGKVAPEATGSDKLNPNELRAELLAQSSSAPSPSPSPSPSPKPKKEKRALAPLPSPEELKGMELPAGLPVEAWSAWVDHRQAMVSAKRIRTTDQAKRQLDEIAGWIKDGYDATKIINASLTAGWQGLFAKPEHKRKSQSSELPRYR